MTDIPTTLGYVKALLDSLGLTGLIQVSVGITVIFSSASFLLKILR